MARLPSVGICLLLLACTSAGAREAELKTTVVPAEILPGDVFRLEVSRSSEDYAEFQLDIPTIERLYLLATEKSPVEYRDGRYHQSETWIFQADASGEIRIEEATVKLISGQGESSVVLPPLAVTVLPYPETDTDPAPLDWESIETGSSGLLKNVILLTGLLLSSILYAAAGRRKKADASVADQPDLLGNALADLDAGKLNAVSLYKLHESGIEGISAQLNEQIELALYANRGHAGDLAACLRKELVR